jgi:hypothetical protein
VSVPIYSVPVVQAVPVQLGYIQNVQAGAVYLSPSTQGAAVTAAQAPVINIKLEAPPAAATTAPAPQRTTLTAQAPPMTCGTSSLSATPQIGAATPTTPTYAVANVLVSQQPAPMQLYVVSKSRTGLFKNRAFFKNK